MRRVYIETSVWSMILPGQNPALHDATVEFLDRCKSRILSPCISAVVAEEIARSPDDTRRAILKCIGETAPTVLPLTADADDLAKRFIDQGVLSNRRFDDARHVACAFVSEVDLLVSWNYRHIANVRKAEGFNAVAILAGYAGDLALHTPLEVLEWA